MKKLNILSSLALGLSLAFATPVHAGNQNDGWKVNDHNVPVSGIIGQTGQLGFLYVANSGDIYRVFTLPAGTSCDPAENGDQINNWVNDKPIMFELKCSTMTSGKMRTVTVEDNDWLFNEFKTKSHVNWQGFDISARGFTKAVTTAGHK